MRKKYIVRDAYDCALSFFGGSSHQVEDKDADTFDTLEQAEAARKQAGESGGYVDAVQTD